MPLFDDMVGESDEDFDLVGLVTLPLFDDMVGESDEDFELLIDFTFLLLDILFSLFKLYVEASTFLRNMQFLCHKCSFLNFL